MNAHVLSAGLVGDTTVPGDPSGRSYVGFNGLGPVAFSYDLSDPGTIRLLSPVTGQVADGGFETPSVGNGFLYADQIPPGSTPWIFDGTSGLAGIVSGFSNPPAPQGSQVAFLQGNGTISQAVTLAAGTYRLSL